MSRRYSLVAALILGLPPAMAAAQSTVWISSAKDIRQVTTSGTNTGRSASVHLSSADAVGHLTFGPDGWLYFAEDFPATGCISRLNPAGAVARSGANTTYAPLYCTSALAAGIGELRFDASGALVFATPGGVLKLPACAVASPATCAVAATLVNSASGSALDHAPDGSLLFTDGDAVGRDPSTSGFPIPVSTPVAIDVVTGAAASVFPAFPTGTVCVSAGNAIGCYTKTGTPLSALRTFDAIDKPQGWAFAKDDTAWVATSVNPAATLTAGQAPHNGLLWRVTGAGATRVYPTRINGPQPPIVGVAVPLTSKTINEAAATDTHTFVVGPDVFSVTTPQPCRLSLTVMERLSSQVQSCFNSTGLTLAPATYLGETFPTEYDVQTLGTQSCFSPGLEATVITTAFYPAGNLAAIKRPIGAPQGSNTCVENTQAQWLLAAPNDAGTKTGSNSFSGFMGALVRAAGGQPATVQLLAPLQNAPLVTTDPTPAQVDAAVEQNRGNVTVKFTLTGGTAAGPAYALFSVQRLGSIEGGALNTQTGALCDVDPQDAVTGPPLFRRTADNSYHFNLNTSGMLPLACTQPGLYAFGISFPIDGIATPITFLVELK
jgi:hypothetical protein